MSAPTVNAEKTAEIREKITLKDRVKSLSLGQYSYIFIFVALFLVYYLVSGQLRWTGVTNILRHSAVVGLISLGMGFIIITGDIDLSAGAILGSVAGFACLIFNVLQQSGVPMGATILLTVLFCLIGGALLGFINGILIGKMKLPAFIVTLATQLIFRSVTQYTCNSLSNQKFAGVSGNMFQMNDTPAQDAMYAFGNGKLLTLPISGLIFLAVAIIMVYISTSTKYGKRLYAIGSNVKAAHMAGINVAWTRVSVFTIMGLLCGIGAVLWISMYSNVDSATLGVNNEMFAIAAVVLGGISMSGGKGKVVGIIFGALSYTVIDKIIAALDVNSLINNAIKGVILLIAILIQVGLPAIKQHMANKKAKR